MQDENEKLEKERFDKIWIEYETEQSKEAELADEIMEPEEPEETEETEEATDKPAKKPVLLAEQIKEEIEYLDSILKEYERFVLSIGSLKYTAAMLLYYRDDIQDSLEFLKRYADIKDYWKKVVYLDNILRGKANIFVYEVGYNNFKQYQIVNNPPKLYWWWYLNKQVSAPPVEKRWWEVWK